MKNALSASLQAEPKTETRAPKVAEIIANDIRRQIIRGELKDGDTLSAEAHLIAQYDVSRPTIREAIRILESERLITVSRGARGGARVSAPTFELVARAAGVALQGNGATIGDVYEIRTIIEPPAARMVAETNAKQGAKVLRRQLDFELSLVDDRAAVTEAIADFHAIMVDLCGSVTMKMFAHSLQHIVERHLALATEREKVVDEEAPARRVRFGLRSHLKLIELIEDEDGAGAEQHWLNHMRAAGVYWLSEVSADTPIELLD